MQLINKKVLVIGLGSIGERHVRNLKKLGCISIYVLRRKNTKPRTINFEDYNCVFSIDEAISNKIDAAIIASPSNNHTEQLNILVNNKIPVLIEVPISNKIDSLKKINDQAELNKVPILVGHNIKYHPSLKKIYDLVKSNKIGKIHYSRSQFGEYLPDCHPWQDYKKRYEARKDLGGGVILTSIHEIDHAIWLQGKVEYVTCISRTLKLDIDVEDTAIIVMEHEDGSLSEVSLDFIQRIYSRSLQICASDGTLEWELKTNKLKLYDIEAKKWNDLTNDKDYDFNNTYINELVNFSDIIFEGSKPVTDLRHSIHVLNVALSAVKSSHEKKTIKINKEE